MSLANVKDARLKAAWGAAGAVVFIAVLGGLDALTRGAISLPALVPPFGASLAIVFFTPESPLGRVRNVLLGHFVSAMAASVIIALLPNASNTMLACIAVPLAIVLMLATKSFHPPGGATALLAAVSMPKLGFGMILCPVLLGAVLLVAIRFALDFALAWTQREDDDELDLDAPPTAD